MDDDDHPLLVELSSLRETAVRFQASHEAHAAAIKLQRHSLDASRIHEHAAALEQENIRLTHEINVLRTQPDVPDHPAVTQVQELSLALRRISDKIVLTEDTLFERTSELTDVRSELARARHTVDGAYELAARTRAREEASKARERELEFKARASEEERKMVDLAVQEYADLVRNLEGRKSANHPPPTSNGSASTTSLQHTLQDGKSNLHQMLTAFSTESESLHATIAELNAKASSLQMTLDAERLAASHDRTLLSQHKTELDKLNLEDQTAAKMVARYMKFSQASTNALQQQITTLKTRHASIIATLELQLSITQSQLSSERTRTARLQDALDELCEDLARESYGRRREVTLRLALLSREEGVAEFLRRWARRARELYARCFNPSQPVSSEDSVQEAFYRVVADADSLLSTLDDDIQFSDGTCTSGSMARITLAREAVDAMRSELQDEVQKRMEAVRKAAFSLPNDHLDKTAVIEDLSRPEDAVLQANDRNPDQPPLTPNDNASPKRSVAPVELSQPLDTDSPASTAVVPEGFIDDPLVVSDPATSSAVNTTDHTIVKDTPSPSIQDSASTSVTLLVEEEPKTVKLHSPAVSTLDLREDSRPSLTEGPPAIDVVPIRTLPTDAPVPGARFLVDDTVIPSASISAPTPAVQPTVVNSQEDLQPPYAEDPPTTNMVPNDTPAPNARALPEDDKVILSTSTPSLTPAVPCVAPNPPSPTSAHPTLLFELEATKHRYDALQRAFRDCSLALKELKRALASSSPSPHIQTKLRQHLEMALARIDDYAEDARVELEIRIADEELTVRGFEMVLSVPGALVDAAECAEVETSARAFIDGTDQGVARALDKFGKKLEDVQHDVAVVKRAVHGLAVEGEEGEEGTADEAKDTGAGWSAWTAGLLGASSSPSRSPTPVETFGTVMTSPRLRRTASLKQLRESSPERGPLAGLNLRIPMPSASFSPSHVPWTQLGLGRPMEGETRQRTLSSMYAVGGLRPSSVGLGVGFGGSSSSARPRGMTGLRVGVGGVSSPLHAGGARNDTRVTREEANDFGGVE